jgi:2'-5' RNA ligase
VRELVLPAAEGVSDSHYVYPPADLHVTIANLDRYAGLPTSHLEQTLAGCLDETPPIRFDLRGLAVSRNTVYLQVHATPVLAFYSLRASLLRRLEPGRLPRLPRPADVMAFSNVLRFRTREVAVAAAITIRHRNDFFGSFPVDTVELVKTDKVLSTGGTVVIARCTRNRQPE